MEFTWQRFCMQTKRLFLAPIPIELTCSYTLLKDIQNTMGLNSLNDKCISITANQCISSVRFSPTGPAAGQLVTRKGAAVYLGSLLTDSFDNKAKIFNRLGRLYSHSKQNETVLAQGEHNSETENPSFQRHCSIEALIKIRMYPTDKGRSIPFKCFSKQIPQTYSPTTPHIHRSLSYQ